VKSEREITNTWSTLEESMSGCPQWVNLRDGLMQIGSVSRKGFGGRVAQYCTIETQNEKCIIADYLS